MTRSMPQAGQPPLDDGSGVMFDGIAPTYDRLNRILSLGADRSWRRNLLRALSVSGHARILDIATGTGDIACAVAAHHPQALVVGLDPSSEMLTRAVVKAAPFGARVVWTRADAQALPFAANTFDVATLAFGIRNVPNRERALSEIARVLRARGKAVILELCRTDSWLSPFVDAYVRHMMPRFGAWLTGSSAYRYLASSIESFPRPDEFAALMRRAGFGHVDIQPQSLGAACLFVAEVQ